MQIIIFATDNLSIMQSFSKTIQKLITFKTCATISASCNSLAYIGHLVQLSLDKSLQTIVSSNWPKLQAHVPHTDVSTSSDIWSRNIFKSDIYLLLLVLGNTQMEFYCLSQQNQPYGLCT